MFPAVYQGWADQGIAVVAHDSQGFGHSKGDDAKMHAWIDDFQRWVDDVYQIRQACFLAWLFPVGTHALLDIVLGSSSRGSHCDPQGDQQLCLAHVMHPSAPCNPVDGNSRDVACEDLIWLVQMLPDLRGREARPQLCSMTCCL